MTICFSGKMGGIADANDTGSLKFTAARVWDATAS